MSISPAPADLPVSKRIWISWNRQRRNIGLARAVNATLYMSELQLPGWLRLPAEFYNSWQIIHREKPDICFAMNPSIFASWWLAKLKKPYNFILVTDLHTLNIHLEGIKKKIFSFFFKAGIRDSDIVIVTNEIFKSAILSYNKSIVCIPDQLPQLRQGTEANHGSFVHEKDKTTVLVISSFADDEPLEEIMSLDEQLAGFQLYITGNWKKKYADLPKTKNISFLGFVDDDEYDALLFSVDGIVVLTTVEGCLCCGAYEAYAAEKPLILSNTRALRDFFEEAPIYTEHTPQAIMQALKVLKKEKIKRGEMMAAVKKNILLKFEAGIARLEELLAAKHVMP